MNRRERRRHEAMLRTTAAAEAKAMSPEAVRERAERRAAVERLRQEEAERWRGEVARAMAIVDADAELAADVAAIEQADPAVIDGIVCLFDEFDFWPSFGDGETRFVTEEGRVCVADCTDLVERLRCERRHRRITRRWLEQAEWPLLDSAARATAIENARQLGLITEAPPCPELDEVLPANAA